MRPGQAGSVLRAARMLSPSGPRLWGAARFRLCFPVSLLSRLSLTPPSSFPVPSASSCVPLVAERDMRVSGHTGHGPGPMHPAAGFLSEACSQSPTSPRGVDTPLAR